jgi:hypothetical protein
MLFKREADCLLHQKILNNVVGVLFLTVLKKGVRLQDLVTTELVLVVHENSEVAVIDSLRSRHHVFLLVHLNVIICFVICTSWLSTTHVSTYRTFLKSSVNILG